eukprot:6214088-Amphidinium_carterae.1
MHQGGGWALYHPASSLLWQAHAIQLVCEKAGVRKLEFRVLETLRNGSINKHPVSVLTNCGQLERVGGWCGSRRESQPEGRGQRGARASELPSSLADLWIECITECAP